MSGFVSRFAPFGIGLLLVAGIVHLAIVLLMPFVTSSNAALRLASGASLHAMEQLQPVADGGETLPFPFADPALITAVCRFDLAEGPVSLKIPTGDSFLSVAVLTPTGRVAVALTDRAATRRLLDIVLVTAAQQRQLESQDPDDEPVQELRLRLGNPKGMVVVRSLALREAEKQTISAQLGRATCQQE